MPRCTPPGGSAPPPLSLTRIASIPALVKLTSSLNYANKAVVICICTVWWHVASEGLGWGGRGVHRKRGAAQGGIGRIMGGMCCGGGGGALANQSGSTSQGSSAYACIRAQTTTQTPKGSRRRRVTERATPEPAGRAVEHSSSLIHPGAGIYRLEPEWLVQVQAQTTALLC